MGAFNVAGYFSVSKVENLGFYNKPDLFFNQNVINLQSTNYFCDRLKKEMRDNKKENNSDETFLRVCSQQSQLVTFENAGFFPAPDLCRIVSLSSLRLSVVLPTFSLVSSVESSTMTLDPSPLLCPSSSSRCDN